MTETIETADLEIAYERWGPAGGRPVLLVHGWPDDVHCWDAHPRASTNSPPSDSRYWFRAVRQLLVD